MHTQTNPPAQSFEKVRADHATETTQDYVEAIADTLHWKGTCRVKDLSEQLGVSHVTVSRIINRLVAEGYVDSEPYYPIRLTPAGEQLAARARHRHQLVFTFLLALGVSEEEAKRDAEGIEHHVGPATRDAMNEFIKQKSAELKARNDAREKKRK